ncbi:gliding motility-associated C-terminal domain-containing protein [Hymenobacter negativus]|uniref:Gliding motility-associated C-terminal domain-containing protein n=1 Tax=Hymenobacter negativus TaxID=2795026 RepID=A0ABS3QKX2_9BACT|nr:gliding motility-associated C-terminal domain-containing protein [Hymenobacter negativus]MBO2011892.1 gliding motility-associated C-terminal domain-containing protein [Hymenobacter negativus]
MPILLFRTGFLLAFLWLWAGLIPAAATHLVGGELTYQYLDASGSTATPFRYRITARVYFNKETDSRFPDGVTDITIAVFSQAAGGGRLLQQMVPRASFSEITPAAVPGCPVLVPRVTLAIYNATVSLPAVNEGYRTEFSLGNRNAGIANLTNSGNETMTLSVSMPPGTLPNTSPIFSDDAIAVICLGDTVSVLNNAYDADGDRLSYRFGTPNGAAVNLPVNYVNSYNSQQPFGPTGYAAIDARTGLARYVARSQGTFLLAIDVQEFRTVNGREILLGTLRRDIQVVVRVCSGGPNNPPAFTAATLARRDFQLEEGQALAFNITATDPDAQPLTMTVGSALLDGPGRVDATVNGLSGAGSAAVGSVQANGTGSVTGAFRLQAGCGLARPSPYDVIVTVTDQACNQKSIAGVFRITVTKPGAPARIRGDSVLCLGRTATYTTLANPRYTGFRWTVQGGQVLGPANGTSVQVQWTSAGTRTVAVRGLFASGCPTDSVVRTVEVQPGPVVTGPLVYCRKASTGLRYTVAGPAAAYQWTVTDGTLVEGQGTNTAVVDIPEGSTATLLVADPALPCPTTLRVSLDNRCLYFYNVITPNGDGQNDVFTIENLERYPNTSLTVFNRWGRRMYHSDDYHNTYGGEGLGPGIFYYLCQLADGTRYKGWFEVVK